MTKVLIIDNSDSFTYNLVESFRQIKDCTVEVLFLEDLNVKDLEKYNAFVLSPGPGLPSERKSLNTIIKAIIDLKRPLLGVCLGHQAIVEFFNGKTRQLQRIVHGESSVIKIHGDVLFVNLSNEIEVGRYHSWVSDETSFPSDLKVSSHTKSGLIMSFYHKKLNVRGVQFHPESILTKQGNKILANWLAFCVN